MLCLHIWDFIETPIASVAGVTEKLTQGWVICPVITPKCSVGGIASITHALVAPGGRLFCRLTADTVAKMGPSAAFAEPLHLDSDLIALEVPASERELAWLSGARWISHAKKWGARQGDLMPFSRWLPEQPERLSAVPDL